MLINKAVKFSYHRDIKSREQSTVMSQNYITLLPAKFQKSKRFV